MELEKYTKLEACNDMIEDLLLQELELKHRLRRAELKIKQVQENISAAKDDDLKYIYAILSMHIEQYSVYKRSLFVIENNKKFYDQRFHEIIKK